MSCHSLNVVQTGQRGFLIDWSIKRSQPCPHFGPLHFNLYDMFDLFTCDRKCTDLERISLTRSNLVPEITNYSECKF